MKDEFKGPSLMDEIAEAWSDTDLGVKLAFIWLSLVLIGLVVVGIIFPIAGLIMLGVAVVVGTIAALVYLFEY